MKKITNYILICTCALGFSSCVNTFLDLEPLDAKTDVIYFKTPEHFREYANGLYGQLLGWQSSYGSIFDHMDAASDLSTCFRYSYGVGTGVMGVPNDDSRWGNCYGNIRATNHMFERAVSSYTGNLADIKKELAEGHFFRAYNYFYLLKFFGGVPVVTKVLDVTSPELYGKRNSRYEVVNLILSDLDEAIAGLPLEESVQLSEIVMGDAAYSLWNYNNVAAMKNLSSRYLFNIEEEASNPAGAGRATNKEFIIASVYSQETRKGQVDLNQVIYTDMRPSRKLIDMFLCTDGLPVSMSDKFQGYKNPGDEFQNRDFRLTSYVGSYSTSLTVESCGYGVSKFAITDIQRQSKDESANYPVLRLAEVYLNYAEAVMERYGEISDDQLNKSINKIRARAGIANLTNALAKRIQEGVPANATKTVNQVMLDEIRRERALELYMEGFRCDDLKRWGIAEKNLNESRCGAVVGNASYPTAFIDENGNATSAFNPAIFTKGTEEVETGKGKLPCVVLLKSSDCAFTKGDYLWAIPRNQINLNSNLVQNPGY